MTPRPWMFAALLGLAAVATGLLLAGPDRLLGIDTGNLGFALLMTATWSSLWLVGSLPHSALEGSASPGEWRAWIGSAFLTVAVAWFALKLPLFAVPGPVWQNPDAAAAGRTLAMLLIAWAIVSFVLAGRWRDRVSRDERDRQIEAHASQRSSLALVIMLVALALLLGFSPPDRLQWATPLLLANLLLLLLMLSWLAETALTALSYWRDRRGA
jgi:uncharacterized membrane protein